MKGSAFLRGVAPVCGALLVMTTVAVSCGGGSTSGGTDVVLSAEAARGKDIARTNGCSGCHGGNGQGGVAPKWQDLYGSQVKLKDGSTVTADEKYLTTAIRNPSAQIVDGSNLKMPSNNLSDDEIAAIVAYIKELSSTPTTAAASESSEGALSGIVRNPAPQVDAATIPSLTTPGTDITFRARPGGLQAVYFGYTNCPDACPTTMSDLAAALRQLPADDSARVDTVMVTIDPSRDLATLPDYVRSFNPAAQAGGTADDAALRKVTDSFGVSYAVTTNSKGQPEVAHTTYLYLVDDKGRLVLTWPFGTKAKDMASDLSVLLAEQSAGG
jgi:protein SCO1/2